MKAADDRQAGKFSTVHVPLRIRKRGGRKRVLSPNGIERHDCRSVRFVDNATVRAIARAYRWRDMIESGAYGPFVKSPSLKTSTKPTLVACCASRC